MTVAVFDALDSHGEVNARLDVQPRLTPQEVIALADELNHLLWTDDTPEIPKELSGPFVDIKPGNSQCVSHTVISAALLARRGNSVTTRSGRAWVLDPKQPDPFTIAKHWWMATDAGLVDLSHRLPGFSEHRPIIYENVDLTGRWKIVASFDFEGIQRKAERARKAGEHVMFYHLHNKLASTREQLEAELPKLFEASQGVAPVTYGAIVRHCERLLSGGPSLRGVGQHEAWQKLSHEG